MFISAIEANIAGADRAAFECPVCGADTTQHFAYRGCTNVACNYKTDLETAEEYALSNPSYKGVV